VVRRVTIHGASFIPSWIEWAGKTMKVTNSLENRKERSVEALACPIDRPGVIKLQYLNMKTYKSYSMWWNGGSLKHMRVYDYQVPDVHESTVLQTPGPDFEARKRYQIENFAMGKRGVPSCNLIELRMEQIKTSNSKLLTKT
jgi:hypothetical protein